MRAAVICKKCMGYGTLYTKKKAFPCKHCKGKGYLILMAAND